MVDTTSLRVTELDFDTIKNNLKEFVRQNPEFTDYDFEASGLSFIFDVLAYNTHYNAMYANFVANEMFLDTAVKRNSVISHAKALGYHPRGYRAARAKINLVLSNINGIAPDVWLLRRGTQFTTQINGQYYSFVTVNDYSATKELGNVYTFPEIELYEGLYNNYAWIVPNDNYSNTYVIPNPRVDISSIRLMTYPNASSLVATNWQHSSTLYDIEEDTYAFFTQETYGEKVEVYFGNGAVGVKPATNSIIRIEYVTCNGVLGNGAKVFGPMGSILHNGIADVYANSYIIDLVEESINGSDAESIDEIKFHAAKSFTVQNRAVTPYDYMSIIRRNFTNIDAIKVWGGEDHYPAQYNSVMICIKPQSSDYLTESEKTYLRNLLKNNSVMNIRPLFVDPEYLDIDVTSTIKYDPTKLSQTTDLKAAVRAALISYSDVELEKFNKNLLYSNLSTFIDNSNISIVSNLTILRLKKYIIPSLGIAKTYYVDFSNSLSEQDGVIVSSTFRTSDSDQEVYFTNKGSNIVMGYNVENKFVAVKNIGTISYDTGTVSLNSLNILEATSGIITVTSLPLVQDINANFSNILRIKPENINLLLVADTKTVNRIVASS